jgi:SNF2 family DNA or RNA helicase
MVTFKTKPFKHQKAEYNLSKDMPVRGLYWEMGTGKTKPVLDTAAYLAEKGKINALMVLAPNGVHRNWAVDEIPKHLPNSIMKTAEICLWLTSKASTKKFQFAAKNVLNHKGFSILLMSYDSMMTDKGRKYAKAFLTERDCLYVLDESPRIKSPGAKRTRRVLESGGYASYRRILTGTLVDDKPFDVYTQIKFLDPHAWREYGVSNFSAFKNLFGVWEKGYARDREYPVLVSYRNMKLLRDIVAKYGSRVTKEQVLDLPPKSYTKRYFSLTAEQKRVYKQIQDEFEVLLQCGEVLSADLAITRLLRLQQVTSGYLPSDMDDDLRPIDGKNPRLDALLSCVEEAGSSQIIIWAKYRNDITVILQELKKLGISAVRYDGECNDDQMAHSIDSFREGKAQVFVSNPAKGGEGITLVNANLMIYYNNYFKLSYRLQSEDRFHRIGQTRKTTIIDLAAEDTVDEHIINTLRDKKELASVVQGDTIRDWI